MRDYETLKVEKEGQLWILRLNRPDKYNAISPTMVTELQEAFREFAKDPSTRVGIITGEGKAFMSGADISGLLQRSPEENEVYNRGIIDALNFLEKQSKPVIAAINGFALGGGMELALACTFRIAAAGTKLGLPEVGLGILPGAGGLSRLPRLIGKQKAMFLILTGVAISAEEALELGILMKVVPLDKLMEEAKGLAQKILQNAPLAVRQAKDAVEMGLDMVQEQAIHYADSNLGILIRSEDMQEGMRAFLDRRKPNFKGR